MLHISLATTFRILHSSIAETCSEIINSKLRFKASVMNQGNATGSCEENLLRKGIILLPRPQKAGEHSMTENNGKYMYIIILLSHSYCLDNQPFWLLTLYTFLGLLRDFLHPRIMKKHANKTVTVTSTVPSTATTMYSQNGRLALPTYGMQIL